MKVYQQDLLFSKNTLKNYRVIEVKKDFVILTLQRNYSVDPLEPRRYFAVLLKDLDKDYLKPIDQSYT